jgi:multiple sugar transport system substrate-binding protein
MNIPKSRLIIFSAIGFVVLFGALVFLGIIPGLKPNTATQKISLAVWGVFDSNAIIQEIVTSLGSQFEIQYREFNINTYESQLINALAAGTGPDVFMIHSSWLPKHFDKLTPVAAEQFSIPQFQSLFPTVVEQDFAPNGFIYASPLYIDTLALFYNKDLFDTAGIALPPKTWADFETLIPKLRKLDGSGQIVRSAAAIGGSKQSISRATDLLSVLMLQSGVAMTDRDFTRSQITENGLNPLLFYVDFANPASAKYTWNDNFRNSIDGFAEESIVMMFNYAHQIPTIKQKNPFLNFGIAPLPQPINATKDVNYANYWGLAVSNRFPDPVGAWNFITAFTTNPNIITHYTTQTDRIPALRNLLAQMQNDPERGVFARAALSARSWPQVNSSAIETIFSNMIKTVIDGITIPRDALQKAESEITALMQR